MGSDYTWTCPKCGVTLEGCGPASLSFIQSNHNYTEHTNRSRFLIFFGKKTNGGYVRDNIAPGVLFRGIAALDDAFFDGARLTNDDHKFLRSLKVCWNQPPEQARFRLNP